MRRKCISVATILIGGMLVVFAGTLVVNHLVDATVSKMEPDPILHCEDDPDGFKTVNWQYWQALNPNIIGWVSVEGTNIDYPIVQAPAENPRYYLNHDVRGDQNSYGVPYLDIECAKLGFNSENALVYGHHMDDGSMFSDFAWFCEGSYAREHRAIQLQTPTNKYKLKVLYVSIIDGSKENESVKFTDHQAFLRWFYRQRAQASVVLDNKTEPDRVVTFCTCSYGEYANERTLVVCALDQ